MKNYLLVFIKMKNDDLQHCDVSVKFQLVNYVSY